MNAMPTSRLTQQWVDVLKPHRRIRTFAIPLCAALVTASSRQAVIDASSTVETMLETALANKPSDLVMRYGTLLNIGCCY